MEKQTILVVHGGTAFDTYEEYWKYLESIELTKEKINKIDWKDNLQKELPEFEVLYPKMPNSRNSRYLEWKLWFEKTFHLLTDEVILIGHSLGGIFLTKYLSENSFPKKIKQLHLVAACYDTEVIKDSLVDFALTKTVENIQDKVEKIFLYQSKDDTSVAYQDALKYKRDLPNAELFMFEDRGHFTGVKIPELINNIESYERNRNF
jgi:predicted alpha/beta hydrolase family esterase